MKILSRPKKNAEEYGKWAVNPYVGCSNQCEYCYLRKGPSGEYLGQDHPVLKKGVVNEEHAYHLAMAEIIEHKDEIIRDGGLFFTFTSDPCLPKTRDLCFSIAHEAMLEHIPVTMLTKAVVANTYYRHASTRRELHLPMPTEDLYGQYIAFGFTLTGCDDQEPYAPKSLERTASMHGLYAAGYKVWASLEPVLDFKATERMFQWARNAGCSHFKIGLLTASTRTATAYYRRKYGDRLAEHLGIFIDELQELNADHRIAIYWKESIRQMAADLLGRDLSTLPNAVGKDWSMFNPKNK